MNLRRSTDGGRTWERMPEVMGPPTAMFYDPYDGGRIHARSHAGLHLSTDGGSNWAQVSFPPQGVFGKWVVALEFDTTRPGRGYLVVGISSGSGGNRWHLYRTDDGGTSWNLLRDFADVPVSSLTLPTDSSTVLMVSDGKLLRSTDEGVTFQLVHAGPSIRHLRRNPNGSRRAFAVSGEHLLLSRNDGLTWVARRLPTPLSALGSLEIAGESPQRIVVFGADYLGRFIWISDDEARSWRRVDGLPGPWIPTGAVAAPWNADLILSSDQGGRGIHRSQDGGITWESSNVGLEARIDRLMLHPDPGAPMYAVAESQLYASVDHGESWEYRSAVGSGTIPTLLAISPTDADRMLSLTSPLRYGTERSLRTSTDGGSSWNRIDLPQGGPEPWSVAITASGAFILGTTSDQFTSFDEGRTWIRGDLDVYAVIEIEQRRPGRAFALVPDGIRITYDAGVHWVQSLLPMRPKDIFAHPLHPSRLYAAGWTDTAKGYYRSFDGGRTWIGAVTGQGITEHYYDRIDFDPLDADRIAILSAGRVPSRSLDGGRSFARLRDGAVNLQRYDLAYDPRDGKLWGTDERGRLSYYRD
jgi:photosystem II stability/assembly factor-like uncharacterized protein